MLLKRIRPGLITALGLLALTPVAQALAGERPATERELRAFLRTNPRHLQARAALLRLLREAAERGTRELLGPNAGKEIAGTIKPLALDLDEALWGAWVREVEALFRNGDWLHTDLRLSYRTAKPFDLHSLLALNLYRRHLPKVEAALNRWPTQTGFEPGLWGLWEWMARTLPNYAMAAFVESLAPLPDQNPLEWPPYPAREALKGRWTSNLPPEPLPRPPFLYPLREHPSPALVVLEGAGSQWGLAMQALLREEPLIGLRLPLFVLPADDVEAVALRGREGWDANARWCLLTPRGDRLYDSRTLPTASEMERAFREHGGPTREAALRAFLGRHPEHAEARLALLGLLKEIAEARTQVHLRLERTPNPDQAEPLAAPLTETADETIWGSYANALDEVFQHHAWWGAASDVPFFPGLGSFDSALAIRSPRVKAVLRRRIVDVENALLQRPDDDFLWSLWLPWTKVLGDPMKRNLLDFLKPLPGTSTPDWLSKALRASQPWAASPSETNP